MRTIIGGELGFVYHFPFGNGCALEAGPNTNCVIYGWVYGLEPGQPCSGVLPGNHAAEDGDYCGDGLVGQYTNLDTWPSVSFTENGHNGTCDWELCYKTTECYVQWSASLGWICGGDDFVEHYFPKCTLTDPLVCP